jgi:hypothetical protein
LVIFEALNALYGDCLLLRYPGPDNKERLWIIDGGPRRETVNGQPLWVWEDVLLPRLKQIAPMTATLPVALGMVSHIDDDHINGIQQLTRALRDERPGQPAPVKFSRFWFNSFDDLIPNPAGPNGQARTAALASLMDEVLPRVTDEHATLVMQSVKQGNDLASDLSTLKLKGNQPVNGMIVASKGQQKYRVEGAVITIIGPMQDRIDKLRQEWSEALQKPSKEARQAALQDLFLPNKALDKAVPNLSSIVVLVEAGGRKLLLTGDANGKYIVSAWRELELGAGPVKIDLLKMPHHGSIRNSTQEFLEFFVADHYVFSANGKYDNPDAPTLEALVKMHGHREITLYFTNADVTWKEPYPLEKNNRSVANLLELLNALHEAYPGPWTAKLRQGEDKSVVVELA